MSILDVSPVIPVVVIDNAATAGELARALVNGGVEIIEVTLRSPAALDAIRVIADQTPEILVGAGTVCTREDAQAAVLAGAQFLVAPASTDRLLDALEDSAVPFLAGTATPSDMLRLLERGLTEAKLFPASVAGGANLLRAIYGPLPLLRFCPTGGITATTAPEYLALPNVGCVGGSWIAPTDAIATSDWASITNHARRAATLRKAASESTPVTGQRSG